MIPTYKVGKPDKNPLFLEKRVYQGSSGKIYPFPMTEKIFDEKVDKIYHAVVMENKYLKVVLLPELGGRVYRALDKTNHYDFVYYNHVIKPQLVGLTGPWISGGIEFNWPQHHRPDSFLPTECYIKANSDGSKTVWISDIDRMYGTKGMAAFTLFPDKAYLQIRQQLFNRTNLPQTFLWWANPAVSVNDCTQSIFPPDVHAVFDHGKRAVSTFPIATGEYYKVDYSAGVDISRYKNVPVPTSYMAAHSDFDFLGNYDYGKKAGLLHVADHHQSPGKKQWTWGNGDFGRAWDYLLTDKDGPYIELMAGTYTDNQPDFTWLKPFEEKTSTEYFMPYKTIGAVKNATIAAAVNLEKRDDKVQIAVYATSTYPKAHIVLTGKDKLLLNEIATLSPTQTFERTMTDVDDAEADLTIKVTDANGTELVTYCPRPRKIERIPDPAEALPDPHALKTTEELYLAGLHLEQYRHATYHPADYYREGLRRDPTDIRLNNAYGRLLYRKGLFAESEAYFRRAVKKQTWKNPNPYSGESYYNLGLSLDKQGKNKDAYDAFFKATWSYETQSPAFYYLAVLAKRADKKGTVLQFIDRALITNNHNMKARLLKVITLRESGRKQTAADLITENLQIDLADSGNYYERYKLTHDNADLQRFDTSLNLKLNNYLELAADYAAFGCYDDARFILQRYPAENPLKCYYLSYIVDRQGDEAASKQWALKGENASTDYVFPNKLNDILVLEHAIKLNPSDSFAHYYLGNLWYDKGIADRAIDHWERSAQLNDRFPTTFRNLSIAYYNKKGRTDRAVECLETAFRLNPDDARIIYELDTLYAKINHPLVDRLAFLKQHLSLVRQRDDCYVEYITLLNETGQYRQAYDLITERQFHPWEGGEGKVSSQYEFSLVELAKIDLQNHHDEQALKKLQAALTYPRSLGEGKLTVAQDNIVNYYIGLTYKSSGNAEQADQYFHKAAKGLTEPTDMMYYNDQPADTIFYQGLALEQLGTFDRAKAKYYQLIRYGEKHLFDQVKIDYFAVSLPDVLLFNEDYQIKNTVHCYYLIGLGYLGLNHIDEGKNYFDQALQLNNHHQGLLRHRRFRKPDLVNQSIGTASKQVKR
jgi:tetratricopeptide (TPR) repeat protein